MPDDEKPYRVYRGGRVKGRLPSLRKQKGFPKPLEDETGKPPSSAQGRARTAGSGPRPKRRRRWGTVFAVVLGVFLAFWTVWTLVGYFSFRDGVQAANKRLPKTAARALADQDGLLLTNSTVILLLGTDTGPGRKGLRHSDSIVLVRADPDHHRIGYLSIPRDFRAEIPGRGFAKINAAYQFGGPALAVRTVRRLTGIDVNHVVIVDFARFKELIDELGGIDIVVEKPILSNKFDCPFSAARCETWEGWRFEKGKQHLDGHRALVYSRIRENRLDPAETDATRAERQQQVLQAISGSLASFGTFMRLPFVGGDLLRPLATDLSPSQLLQLGWVKWRSGDGRALHCRLGGRVETVDGQSYVIGESEENRAVISMFLGESAPQPPPPGSGIYGPGCVVGNRSLGTR